MSERNQSLVDRAKFQLRRKFFNRMESDGQHRYSGLFIREVKWKGNVGHWTLLKDRKGEPMITKVC